MDFDLPEGSKRVIRDILKSKDRNDDGVIDSRELGDCLMAVGFCPTPEDVVFLQKHFDMNGDGYISIDEIMENLSVINMHSLHSKDLMEAFAIFDQNNDGYIGQSELIAIFTAKGPLQMSREEAVRFTLELFKKYDTDYDKRFSYPEFVRMFAHDEIDLENIRPKDSPVRS